MIFLQQYSCRREKAINKRGLGPSKRGGSHGRKEGKQGIEGPEKTLIVRYLFVLLQVRFLAHLSNCTLDLIARKAFDLKAVVYQLIEGLVQEKKGLDEINSPCPKLEKAPPTPKSWAHSASRRPCKSWRAS